MTREEAIKIIDCYDIGFYDLSGEKIPADKLAEAFDMAIDALSADAVHGEWIIGKPTEQGKYMVTLDSFGHKRIDLFYYGKPMMPNRKVRGKCWYRSDDEWGDVVYDDTDILAWQPLPKPYEDGERADKCE